PAPTPVPEPEPKPEPVSLPKPKPEPEPKPEPKPEPVVTSPPPLRPPADPVVEAPPVAVPGEPNAAAVRSMWPTVREKVRQRSRTIDVMLAGAIVRTVDKDTLVLTHESAPLAKRLVEQRNSDVIRDALKDALGVDWKIRCEVGAPTEAHVPAKAAQREEDDMLSEAVHEEAGPRRDPEEAALELLQSELGARRIDGA
ncbi:DNA polymerase III subunit gamma/tau, partial [Mycobacterium manitobense]|nr:DNA polymerase III subunit gamma/tau [[Mycobacterium] manitobense]